MKLMSSLQQIFLTLPHSQPIRHALLHPVCVPRLIVELESVQYALYVHLYHSGVYGKAQLSHTMLGILWKMSHGK